MGKKTCRRCRRHKGKRPRQAGAERWRPARWAADAVTRLAVIAGQMYHIFRDNGWV